MYSKSGHVFIYTVVTKLKGNNLLCSFFEIEIEKDDKHSAFYWLPPYIISKVSVNMSRLKNPTQLGKNWK